MCVLLFMSLRRSMSFFSLIFTFHNYIHATLTVCELNWSASKRRSTHTHSPTTPTSALSHTATHRIVTVRSLVRTLIRSSFIQLKNLLKTYQREKERLLNSHHTTHTLRLRDDDGESREEKKNNQNTLKHPPAPKALYSISNECRRLLLFFLSFMLIPLFGRHQNIYTKCCYKVCIWLSWRWISFVCLLTRPFRCIYHEIVCLSACLLWLWNTISYSQLFAFLRTISLAFTYYSLSCGCMGAISFHFDSFCLARLCLSVWVFAYFSFPRNTMIITRLLYDYAMH